MRNPFGTHNRIKITVVDTETNGTSLVRNISLYFIQNNIPQNSSLQIIAMLGA